MYLLYMLGDQEINLYNRIDQDMVSSKEDISNRAVISLDKVLM